MLLPLVACETIVNQHDTIPQALKPEAIANEQVQTQNQQLETLSQILTPLFTQQWQQTIKQGLLANQQLLAVYKDLQLAEYEYAQSLKSKQPTLDLGLNTQRSHQQELAGGVQHSYQLGIDMQWQIDIWQQRSFDQKAAQLRLMKQGKDFLNAQNSYIAEFIQLCIQGIEKANINQLLDQQYYYNEQQLAAVSDAYTLGLSDARDVIQAKTNIARVQQQQILEKNNILVLQKKVALLLGQATSSITFSKQWPLQKQIKDSRINLKPLLNRRDVQIAWLELLALDAEVASAHRNRFPKLNINLSSGLRNQNVLKILQEKKWFWSLFAGITQPIFDQRKLKYEVDKRILRVQQQEQLYLSAVQQAIYELDTLIQELLALQKQSQLLEQHIALELDNQAMVNEQYLSGVALFESVVTAQERLLDVQINHQKIKSQQWQKLVSLYLALGGDLSQFIVGTGEGVKENV